MIGRIVALVICLAALAGIAIELSALVEGGASLGEAAWRTLRFFTITTNALLVIVFGLIALRGDRFDHPRLVSGTVAAIVLVGVIVLLLLQDVRAVEGATAVSDFLIHRFTPKVGAIYWLLFVPKGRLSWNDPLLWALYPLAYLVYALARGAADGIYAYPFIDVATLGVPQVALNAVLIAIGFVVAGEAMVWLDRTLARRRTAVR